ncbi:lysozyme [Yersinia enterocolitica]|uniref:lysozyme n=1 Tax=Yersinia enterocolitica TaxID=630 RepID=UPI000D875E5B|nr:lysozyme [Yersinia enterocolitica]SQA35818.1 prophage lysozyme; Phage lysin [Yersinia enterocolitica]SUP63150.1 prophage lysozyme; Phage lysin [Yersinia enterocolitica]
MNSTVKRCLVAAILALTVTLPHYPRLKTSATGLKLLADYEGCQLNAYLCSANVWTNGIGHTAGVKPNSVISERDVAVNLVADVQRVERAIAACMPVAMPQPVYDAVVSFTFNVGTGAACRSTLAFFVNKGDWRSACNQLPRWVYVNGVKNQGLEHRRIVEQKRCLNGI